MTVEEKRSKLWAYLRIFAALPFTAGVAIMIYPFVTITDDAGVAVPKSPPAQIGMFLLGVVMIGIAIFLAAPKAFRNNDKR